MGAKIKPDETRAFVPKGRKARFAPCRCGYRACRGLAREAWTTLNGVPVLMGWTHPTAGETLPDIPPEYRLPDLPVPVPQTRTIADEPRVNGEEPTNRAIWQELTKLDATLSVLLDRWWDIEGALKRVERDVRDLPIRLSK